MRSFVGDPRTAEEIIGASLDVAGAVLGRRSYSAFRVIAGKEYS
jgi:hypothetical protein